jgi:hypothetical protein
MIISNSNTTKLNITRKNYHLNTSKCELSQSKYSNYERHVMGDKIRDSKKASLYSGISPKRTTGAHKLKKLNPKLKEIPHVSERF